jgi:hypothetical protein
MKLDHKPTLVRGAVTETVLVIDGQYYQAMTTAKE